MIALVLAVACHSPEAVAPAAEPSRVAEDGGPSGRDTDRCEPVTTSTLPGVRIVGPTLPCTLHTADLGEETAPYTVVVDHDVSGLLLAQVDAGGCVRPGPSGLLVALDVTRVGDDSVAWAETDFGLCAERGPKEGTAHVGTWHDTGRWQARVFGGPSDTSNRPGEPFAPGKYALRIRASGAVHDKPWEVASVTTFELVP